MFTYNRSPKILVAIPQEFLDRVTARAHQEHRTRSDLVREALRRYIGASPDDLSCYAKSNAVPKVRSKPNDNRTEAINLPSPSSSNG